MKTGTSESQQVANLSWLARIKSLKNIPPILRIIWDAAPGVVVWSLMFHLLAALIPILMLDVTRKIIDAIYVVISHREHLAGGFWLLVAAEFLLASLAIILARLVDFSESVLAERYTNHVNILIMRHAATLDLTSYEDPLFYDKLERARVQGADRNGMIQSAGQLIQQFITTITLAAGIYLISPWILIALIAFVVPAFLGETHFAFLGYSLSVQQTPARRELDYLRTLGASKESAKEQKLFGLGPFFVGRYTTLSDELYRQNVVLARRKLLVGSCLSLLGTIGYYGTYAYGIHETLIGLLTLGTLTFLAGAIAGASTNIQSLFSTFSKIADHALFLTDLIEFFSVRPKICFQAQLFSRTPADSTRIRIQERGFRLPWKVQTCPGERQFPAGARGTNRTGRRERPGKNHYRQVTHAIV